MSFRLLSLAMAGAACISLSACASSRNLDESLTDLGANTEMKGVLFTDRSYDYSDIDLTFYEGRLLLTGAMRAEEGRKKLIENAWKVDGVDQVIDEIIIGDRTSIGQGFEDARIDKTLRAKLIGDRDIVSSDYKIAVSGAHVFLLGKATDKESLDSALAHARSVAGVEKVVSYVTVPTANEIE